MWEGNDDEDAIELVPNGYGRILEHLLSGIDKQVIRMNAPVAHVDWSCCNVNVKLHNDELITADHLIITLPLGVLKANAHSLFTPALPAHKINAIQSIGVLQIYYLYISS